MPRVLHYRVYGLPEHRLERMHEQFDAQAEWLPDEGHIQVGYEPLFVARLVDDAGAGPSANP